MKGFKASLFFLILFFVFFPFVGVVKNIDVQPNFVVFSFFALCFFIRYIKVDFLFFCFFVFLCIVFCLSLVFGYYYINIIYVITYFVVLLNVFFLYVFIKNDFFNITSKNIFLFVFVYAVVGIIQYYDPNFMSWAVTRSQEAMLSFSESGRGVRSLASEPATLGKMFNVFNILLIILIHTENKVSESKKTAFGLVVTVVILLLNITIARSAYAVGIQFVFVVCYLFVFYKKTFFVGFVLCVCVFSFILRYISDMQSYRIAQIFYIAFSDPSLLLEQGAVRRLLNIPISINNLYYFGFLGANNNPNVYYASLYTPFGELDYLASNRNLGGFIEWLLKFGLFGIPMMLLYLFFIFSMLRYCVIIENKKYWIGLYFFIATFFITFQDGSPTAPFTWFILFFIYFTLKKKFLRFF
ncbi:hypothetical protein KDW99_03220 [Marinomonas rhizomae]|uniref:hypothetical protein n=1 Tax=Marinomonas rhizomae TaxID=491948 RepID=UPI0021024ABE|nr:hypothetical protein [Marinomonas rhizomae]UTW00170.1 hypothetical protein KDW99_03220 [Marinomonas rhizomae]